MVAFTFGTAVQYRRTTIGFWFRPSACFLLPPTRLPMPGSFCLSMLVAAVWLPLRTVTTFTLLRDLNFAGYAYSFVTSRLLRVVILGMQTFYVGLVLQHSTGLVLLPLHTINNGFTAFHRLLVLFGWFFTVYGCLALLVWPAVDSLDTTSCYNALLTALRALHARPARFIYTAAALRIPATPHNAFRCPAA